MKIYQEKFTKAQTQAKKICTIGSNLPKQWIMCLENHPFNQEWAAKSYLLIIAEIQVVKDNS